MDSLTHSLTHFTSLHFTHFTHDQLERGRRALKARVHTALGLAPSVSLSCPTLRGFGTELARLGTFRGFGTERARLGPFRVLGTERARLGTFNHFET